MTYRDREQAPLSPVQAWLLGHIDTATLYDRMAGSPELAYAHGRAIMDPAYAAALIEEARRLLEDPAAGVETPEEQAYAVYQAATDQADEARLLALEADGQQVGDELREWARDFRDACRLLGLPTATDPVAEPEPEAER